MGISAGSCGGSGGGSLLLMPNNFNYCRRWWWSSNCCFAKWMQWRYNYFCGFGLRLLSSSSCLLKIKLCWLWRGLSSGSLWSWWSWFYGNGTTDTGYGTGGNSWSNGITGGSGPLYGGFGGGSSGNGGYGGGGGGGYSGGDGAGLPAAAAHIIQEPAKQALQILTLVKVIVITSSSSSIGSGPITGSAQSSTTFSTPVNEHFYGSFLCLCRNNYRVWRAGGKVPPIIVHPVA